MSDKSQSIEEFQVNHLSLIFIVQQEKFFDAEGPVRCHGRIINC